MSEKTKPGVVATPKPKMADQPRSQLATAPRQPAVRNPFMDEISIETYDPSSRIYKRLRDGD